MLEFVAIDFETDEFDWQTVFPHNAKPIGLSYCYEAFSGEMVNEYETDPQKIKSLLTEWVNNRIPLVVFNSYFDIPRVEWILERRLSKDSWEDVYILSKLIDENVQGGLKAVYSHYFHEKTGRYKDVDRKNSVIFAEYAKKDSLMTHRLFDLFMQHFEELL